MSRRIILTIILALVATATWAGFVTPGGPRGEPRDAARPSVTVPPQSLGHAQDAARRLADRGLAALEKSQNDDGSFGESGVKGRLGTSAVACLAFLADGNTEFRGRYHTAAEKAIKYLMSCSIRAEDDARKGYLQAPGDTISRMHGHGYAALALTQAYGMFGVKRKYASSADELRAVITDAVRLIERSQSRSGGWYYEPYDDVNDEGSITVCMIQALRAARNCGFAVRSSTIDRAVEYIRKSQNEDGSVRYQLQGEQHASFELTAAGCAVLAYGGRYDDKAIRNARDYLWANKLDEFLGPAANYPYYGLFYATQTLWFDYDDAYGERWKRVYPRIVGWFEEHFDPTTNRYAHTTLPLHAEMQYGDAYRTAFATLTLQIAEGILPIFQR